LDPFLFLKETDPFVRNASVRIADRTYAMKKELIEYLAGKIIENLAKALK
jgi:hypothetical protein